MAVVVLSQYWGVSSFAISDLFYASQNLAVIFKVCSASRVNHLPQFFVVVVVHEATQTSRAFFISCFTTFILRISSNRRLVLGLLKPLSVLFFLQRFYKTNQSCTDATGGHFCFFVFLYLHLLFFGGFFFPRACECDMSKRCSETRTSTFRLCVYPNLVLSECSSASYFYKHCNSL